MDCVCAGPDPRVSWWPQTWRPAAWTWTTSSLSSTTIIPTTARTTSTGSVRYLLFSIRCIWRPVLGENNAFIRDSAYKKAVWRIRDVYPRSDFFPSRIPDPNCLHPGSRILIKELKYFNPKKSKKMVCKLLEM
jgi:hypothetical protein